MPNKDKVIQISFPQKDIEIVRKFNQLKEDFGIDLGQILIRAFIYDWEKYLVNEGLSEEGIKGLRPGRLPSFSVKFE